MNALTLEFKVVKSNSIVIRSLKTPFTPQLKGSYYNNVLNVCVYVYTTSHDCIALSEPKEWP